MLIKEKRALITCFLSSNPKSKICSEWFVGALDIVANFLAISTSQCSFLCSSISSTTLLRPFWYSFLWHSWLNNVPWWFNIYSWWLNPLRFMWNKVYHVFICFPISFELEEIINIISGHYVALNIAAQACSQGTPHN